MCGRFNVIDNPGMRELLSDLGIDLQLPSAINLAPTEQVSLVRRNSSEVELLSARWWLTPSWAKQVDQKYAMFNARSESLAQRAAFKKPFRSQRGIVPISSFIEWRTEQGVKQPYKVSNDDGAIAVAALWDVWEGGDTPLVSCTLVTTAAAPAFAPWHSRMPVMLAADEIDCWLDNDSTVASDAAIFRSELKYDLVLAPLAKAVGNSRDKSPLLLEPVGEIISLDC
ncbi:MAG: SOS response-associated peptidase [Halioglobus sp.]